MLNRIDGDLARHVGHPQAFTVVMRLDALLTSRELEQVFERFSPADLAAIGEEPNTGAFDALVTIAPTLAKETRGRKYVDGVEGDSAL